jgi:hypothetical protein
MEKNGAGTRLSYGFNSLPLLDSNLALLPNLGDSLTRQHIIAAYDLKLKASFLVSHLAG